MHDENCNKSELIDLESRIFKAIHNAPIVTLLRDNKTTSEILEDAEKTRDLFVGIQDEDYVKLGDYIADPINEVSVGYPENYEFLLTTAYQIIAKKCGEDPSGIIKKVRDNLEHEMAHARPAIGEDGLTIRYGIAFYKPRNLSGLRHRPVVNFYGKLKKKIYLQIMNAPSNLSESDKIMSCKA